MCMCYFENTNTTVYSMSALLIHMSYFYFYFISLLHSYFSEPRVVVLTNIVIIVAYFAWCQKTVFDNVIVTCECAVSQLQSLRSIICQRYYYTCLTFLFILSRRSIHVVLNHGLNQETCILLMHRAQCHHFFK